MSLPLVRRGASTRYAPAGDANNFAGQAFGLASSTARVTRYDPKLRRGEMCVTSVQRPLKVPLRF